ncbi:MAG TPA: glycosyltransferase family 1 protein [Burkholderiales bacterium]
MRLVIDGLSARRGGGQTYLLNLLTSFPYEGDEIILLVSPSFQLEIDVPAVQVARMGAWAENPLLRVAWQRAELPRLLRRLRADVLFCPGGTLATRPPPGCRTATMFRNMIPFDAVARGHYPLGYSRVRNWLLERVFLSSMVRADLVIFIADHARRIIEARASGRIHDAVVIPHGVAAGFFPGESVLARPAWIPEGGYLLYVSSIDYYKAQHEVVKGYARLLAMRPGTTEHLVIAGPENDRRYAAIVREEIARLGLQDRILLAGPVPYAQLPALYRHATAHIFASQCENCPNILLESMASGRPVLCSDFPPMPDFGGEAVEYFDSQRPDHLAARAAELLDDPGLQRAIGERGRARAAGYDWQVSARATRDALARLVTPAASRAGTSCAHSAGDS